MTRLILAALLLLISDFAHAQTCSFTGGPCPSANTPLSSTYAKLPSAAANPGVTYYVTDLYPAGGAMISDGTAWRDPRYLTPISPVTAGTSVVVNANLTSNAVVFTGTGVATTGSVTVANAPNGFPVYVQIPSGVMSATGTIGLSISGSTTAAVPLIGGHSYLFQVNNGSLTQLLP